MKFFYSISLFAMLITGVNGCESANPYLTASPLRVPKISVLTPILDQEAVDGSFEISVSFEKVLVDDKWSLYYVSDATLSLGAAIAINLPVTSRSITWDTSRLPAGRYFIYAELSSMNSVITSSAPGSLIVSHAVETGNSAPIVSLSSPNGGEALVSGESTTIRYTGSDADGDVLTYKIEFSSDDGVVWETIVDEHNDMTYDWEITSDQAKGFSYRLRVTATDTKSAAGTDISDRNFSIL
jgi:hypothetical protein